MSQSYTIPQFEMHHRLELALDAAGVDPLDMAAVLGVAKTTVYAYMSGARKPKLGMVRQWAQLCQVPWEWIVTGELEPDAAKVAKSVRISCFSQSLIQQELVGV